MSTCVGTLVWYDVAADGRWEAAAVLLCSACGEIFTTGQPLDERHTAADLLREGSA